MQWFLKCLRQYADFSGRARRAEYWWFALINGVVAGALYLIGVIVTAATTTSQISVDADGNLVQTGGPSIVGMFFLGLFGLWSLALFLPGLAVTVRRLHDTNRSGWWFFLGFVPLVGAIMLLVFEATDGTPGPNQFGADPKGRGGQGATQFGQAPQYGAVGQYGAQAGQVSQFGTQPGQSQYGQAPQYGQSQPFGQKPGQS